MTYKAITMLNEHRLMEAVNELAKEGWELVNVCYNPVGSCYTAFLKSAYEHMKKQ